MMISTLISIGNFTNCCYCTHAECLLAFYVRHLMSQFTLIRNINKLWTVDKLFIAILYSFSLTISLKIEPFNSLQWNKRCTKFGEGSSTNFVHLIQFNWFRELILSDKITCFTLIKLTFMLITQWNNKNYNKIFNLSVRCLLRQYFLLISSS